MLYGKKGRHGRPRIIRVRVGKQRNAVAEAKREMKAGGERNRICRQNLSKGERERKFSLE